MDFIGALRYNVDYNNTNFLQGIIGENARTGRRSAPPTDRNLVPPRMLERGDRAEFIQDFTAAENRALLVTELLDDANWASRGQVLRVWQRLCCTEKGRRAATKMAIGFLEHPVRDVPAILGALWELAISHPCRAEGPASGR